MIIHIANESRMTIGIITFSSSFLKRLTLLELHQRCQFLPLLNDLQIRLWSHNGADKPSD